MSIDSVPVPIQLRRTAETPAGPRPGERPRARPRPGPRRIRQAVVLDFLGELRDYVSTFFRMPRVGPVLIGTILREQGLSVRVFSEAVEEFGAETAAAIKDAQLVAMSVLTYGANRAYAMAAVVRRLNPDALIVMGDVHPTIMPEHCLRHCDFVVRDEGDETIVELLAALEGGPGAPALEEVRGLSFRREGAFRHNPRRERQQELPHAADLSLVERWVQSDLKSLARQGKLSMAVLQASRGCPVACKFCLGSAILGRAYRTRDVDRVMENLHHIRRLSLGEKRVTYIVDNHFFIDKEWTREILRRIVREGIKLQFIAFGQYFVGRDPEMLDLLREAGFIRIFCGLESINARTLEEYNKKQNAREMFECVRAMEAHGVRVHGSFMLGGETDTLETVRETIDFSIRCGMASASFYGLCEYPFESHPFVPATNMLPKNRLLPHNLDHFNLNFVSIYPKCMPPSQLQRGLIEAYTRFYSWRRALGPLAGGDWDLATLRGMCLWGHFRLVRQMRDYLPFLEQCERGKYDQQGRLLEDRLGDELPTYDTPLPAAYAKLQHEAPLVHA